MTLLAVPIAGENPDQATRRVEAAAKAGAEIIELRTDYLENLSADLAKTLISKTRSIVGARVPIIVTCRDPRQGGVRPYPLQLRIDVLATALTAGAEYIDFEYENFLSAESRERIERALGRAPEARLILSAHSFDGPFAEMTELYRSILGACPTAIPKLVYKANHINDCFEAFDLLHDTRGERIVFCMGEAGLISRIIAKKLGGFLTFASIAAEAATAPGQLTVEQLTEAYRYDEIDADTELFGVIACPVAHSLSPAIHNACFADAGMNRLYLPLLVEGGRDEFDLFLDNIRSRQWLDFAGFSVTIPHKHNALAYARRNEGYVEPLAEKIGAVNTLLVGGEGELSAYNTDYGAALDAITSGSGISRAGLNGLPVAVIGAGGVARAIVAGLADAGAIMRIYNRTVERGEKLASEFGCDFAGLDDLPNVDAKLVVNCTSIGMHPKVDETPLPRECIKEDMVVFDTVYNPAETLLLRQAKQAGATTIDGISMFVNQALAQFKHFTDQGATPELMRKTVMGCLHRQ